MMEGCSAIPFAPAVARTRLVPRWGFEPRPIQYPFGFITFTPYLGVPQSSSFPAIRLCCWSYSFAHQFPWLKMRSPNLHAVSLMACNPAPPSSSVGFQRTKIFYLSKNYPYVNRVLLFCQTIICTPEWTGGNLAETYSVTTIVSASFFAGVQSFFSRFSFKAAAENSFRTHWPMRFAYSKRVSDTSCVRCCVTALFRL